MPRPLAQRPPVPPLALVIGSGPLSPSPSSRSKTKTRRRDSYPPLYLMTRTEDFSKFHSKKILENSSTSESSWQGKTPRPETQGKKFL